MLRMLADGIGALSAAMAVAGGGCVDGAARA